jgi:hypothetical protein
LLEVIWLLGGARNRQWYPDRVLNQNKGPCPKLPVSDSGFVPFWKTLE